MKPRLTILPICFILAMNTFSQEKTISIYGKIYSVDTLVANVHVFNLTKKIGAISNDIGEFKLVVSENDTLYISSLEYEKTKVIVTKTNIEAKEIFIKLNPLVNELEEIFLRHLTGNLSFDIANKPIDTIPKHNYEFKLSDLNKVLPNDDYAVDKRVNAQDVTDPIGPMGAGATLPDKRYQQLLKLKRELKQKKDFPDKIKRDLGIAYFTKNLNIPEDQINLFLSYCEYRDVVEKYYNNNLNEINDFDAVFSYMLKSENIDRLKYGNHGYLINTIKAFPVPKFSGIYFQLMETKKNSTNTGVQNVSYATIRVCSKTLSMKGLKLLIVPSNCCSNNKSYRKILF